MPGSPYTGSTLLGLLLDDHPACASVGAATGLIRRTDLATYRCSCGALFRECRFWSQVAERTRTLGHPVDVFKTDFWNTHLRFSHNRVINALLVRSLGAERLTEIRDRLVGKFSAVRREIAEAGWNTWSLATAVLEQTGKSVFVDSARDHQRPKYLVLHPMLDVKVIHLVRDPRGNTASIMKHTGLDVATAARRWTRYNKEAARLRRYLPAESWMSLHYEDLCADPHGVLNQISDFLGIERADMTNDFQRNEHHIIGNSWRLKGLSEIREDRSWENKLGHAELSVIGRIAGPTSRHLGFSWP